MRLALPPLAARAALSLLLALPAPWALAAGEFAIMPLRVSLDRANRAAEIVIRNDDKAPLRMQIEARAWRQDAEGRDHYDATDGLIFFPRALEVPPGDSRIVRVGIRAAPVAREETYRLFIEQLPPPEAAGASGATLRVLLRVGVPVFVAPAQPERRAQITRLEVKGGQARIEVANAGNVHAAADLVELVATARDGSALLRRQLPERYFLAGAVRPFMAEIPGDVCRRAAAVEVSIVGDGVDLRRRAEVGPGSCQ
jgi:fimbrial chaperone protein